jgi:RecA-family ATPase
MHLISRAGEDAVLGAFNRRSSRVEPTRLYHQLLEMAGDIKPVLIAIASSANVFAGSEIDRMQVQQFVGLLTRIAIRSGGGLILIAHPSLTGIGTDTGLSGSTQWHNAVRARMYLRGVSDLVTAMDSLRQLECRKNQHGPLSSSVTMRWDDAAGLFLPVGIADFAAAERSKAERLEKVKEVFIAILCRYQKQNGKANDRPGANYAPNKFSKEKEAMEAGCSKEDLAQAMLDLLREEHIYVEESGRPSHKEYNLRIKPGAEGQE